MKIGIIIPDRGDRPGLTRHCLMMMGRQSFGKHNFLETCHVDSCILPPSNACDITKRYRFGYDNLKNVDLIAFIENDDWYSFNYIEEMVDAWKKAGEPDLFGTRQTIYYHLKLKAWYPMLHESRSSAMNTLIKPNKKFPWPVDYEPFTDIWLWNRPELTKALWNPALPLSIGMKHGVGMTGGKSHIDRLHRYVNQDQDMEWLMKHIDADSFKFYHQYSKQLNVVSQ